MHFLNILKLYCFYNLPPPHILSFFWTKKKGDSLYCGQKLKVHCFEKSILTCMIFLTAKYDGYKNE